MLPGPAFGGQPKIGAASAYLEASVRGRPFGRRAGYTLLEVTIAATLFVVIFLASITLIERDRRLSRSALQISQVELMAQDMLFGLEQELANAFGSRIARIVAEVTDDKTLAKEERKRLQVEHAASLSHEAKLVKLADKICNLRDVAERPPAKWDAGRSREYFDWAKRVIDGLRGAHPRLEAVFDRVYKQRPHG